MAYPDAYPEPTYSVTAITELTPLSSPWGIQDAATVFFEYNGLALTADGCSEEGTKNCSATCSEVNKIFASPSNFHNCLAYPTILQHMSGGNITEAERNVAQRYAVDTTQTNVTMVVGSCISGYQNACLSDPRCGHYLDYHHVVSECGWTQTLKSNDTFPLTYPYPNGTVLQCLQALCISVDTTVNQDLGGGVGVYISYYMQAVLSLAIFALLAFWHIRLYFMCLVVPAGPPEFRRASVSVRKVYISLAKHMDALITAVIEFQKAQCYFMSSIQIASMVVMEAGLLDSTNLQQLSNNYNLIIVVCLGGTLPITFVLFWLRAAGKQSWELCILSTVTISLSMAAYFIARGFNLKSNEALLANGTSYPGCGTINPMAFCYFGTWTETGDKSVTGWNTLSVTEGIIIYSVLVLVLMLLDQCSILNGDVLLSKWLTLKSHFDDLDAQLRKFAWPERLANLFDLVVMLRSPPDSKAKARVQRCNLLCRLIASLSGLFIGFGYLVCFYMYFRELLGVGRPAVERSGAIPTDIIQWKNWSFGQVVAVTVLLPPVFSYLAFEIRGMEKTHQSRLPNSWKVVAIAPLQVTAETLAAGDAIPLRGMAAAPATVSDNSHTPESSMPPVQATQHI